MKTFKAGDKVAVTGTFLPGNPHTLMASMHGGGQVGEVVGKSRLYKNALTVKFDTVPTLCDFYPAELKKVN